MGASRLIACRVCVDRQTVLILFNRYLPELLLTSIPTEIVTTARALLGWRGLLLRFAFALAVGQKCFAPASTR